MEPIESRSDTRHRIIPARPSEVFAAMSDPARVARWWGPAGFTNTMHKFEFAPGGSWLLTMHGPDGASYPNELTIELHPHAGGTEVRWRQTFDTVEHYSRLAQFVACAKEQNLERLAGEVLGGASRA